MPRNALHRAYETIAPQLEGTPVSVDCEARTVRYGLTRIEIPVYASKNECLKAIRTCLREYQAKLRRDHQREEARLSRELPL